MAFFEYSVFVMSGDIEDLPERIRELELKRNQLRTLIDNIPDPVYIKDKQCRFINANDRLLRIAQLENLEQLVGKTDRELFPHELADSYHRDDQAVLQHGATISKDEPGIDHRGEPIVVHTYKAPVRDRETGEIVGLVGIGRDVTEITQARDQLQRSAEDLQQQKEELSATLDQLKQAQAHLVQSEKMASLGTLTAGVAHEINNPINFVYAGVNSVLRDFADVKQVVTEVRNLSSRADPAEAISRLDQLCQDCGFDDAFEALEETLNDIKFGATRITEIVAGLSRFSRLGNEAWQITDIHEDIDSVLVLLKNKYKTGITVVKEFERALPQVECFPGKLNQAFMNILSNAADAIQANGGEGVVTIATSQSERFARISIRDDGVGMDEATCHRIFDPFFTTKAVGQGVGLGLSITYSIIQDHSGNLAVESQPGKGSEFLVELPFKHPTPKPKQT